MKFSSQDIDFVLDDEQSTREWLTACISAEEKFAGSLHYIFCSDAFLLEKNQTFLDHDTYTDIITFDYSEEDVLNGEILISIDRVRDNAKEIGIAFDLELRRVMSHGLLHLCGYGDKGEVEKTMMRSKEEEWMRR